MLFIVLINFLFCLGDRPVARTLEGVFIEELDLRIYEVLEPNVQAEILADGFKWAEGPVWLSDQNKLLFSDVPENKVYEWSPSQGLKTYLEPSGFTGTGYQGSEPGSNGLAIDHAGSLILCQHGDRRIARMTAPLHRPDTSYETLVARYNGMRLNSPNDLVLDRNGVIYFTDPPYGLPNAGDHDGKELTFQGVYRLAPNGNLELLIDSLTRPNGIALSADERTLYVSNSDFKRAYWIAYRLMLDGQIDSQQVLYNATDRAAQLGGVPDGLVVSSTGTIFATGPGGIYIFSPDQALLGVLRLPVPSANCTLDASESALYITADNFLLQVPIKTP